MANLNELGTNDLKLVFIKASADYGLKGRKDPKTMLAHIQFILNANDEDLEYIKKAVSTTTAQTANALEKGDDSKLQNNMTPVKGETLDSQNQND